MKKNPEQPASSDADLFRLALDGVTPITHSNKIPLPRPTKKFPISAPAVSPTTVADNWSDHHVDHVALTSYLRSGINNMTLRKLRRGHWPVQASIDLHGLSSNEARTLLANFLNQALTRQYRCINVIHGKGWRAAGGEGILKLKTRHWLTQHPQVLAFCEAPAQAGGGGAVWVLLKSTTGLKEPDE
jgi:DNA-nicking Smr family endonuclease